MFAQDLVSGGGRRGGRRDERRWVRFDFGWRKKKGHKRSHLQSRYAANGGLGIVCPAEDGRGLRWIRSEFRSSEPGIVKMGLRTQLPADGAPVGACALAAATADESADNRSGDMTGGLPQAREDFSRKDNAEDGEGVFPWSGLLHPLVREANVQRTNPLHPRETKPRQRSGAHRGQTRPGQSESPSESRRKETGEHPESGEGAWIEAFARDCVCPSASRIRPLARLRRHPRTFASGAQAPGCLAGPMI